MKYAHINEDGKILGWYDLDIHGIKNYENEKEIIDLSNIPNPHIQVEDAVWQKAISKKANAYDEISKTFIYKDFRTLKDFKLSKINDLKTIYIQKSNENITYKDVIYKGGETSASAIAGAVNLAKSLNEPDVTIIDFEDKSNTLSFEEALELSSLLAKSWRESFFKYKELKRQVSIVTTVEELDQIKW